MFLEANIGAKTQCLSKEIGVGVAIRCWRRSQLYYYYQCSKNIGADQLLSYCEADLCLCFRIGSNPVFSRCGSYVLVICPTVLLAFNIYVYYMRLSKKKQQYGVPSRSDTNQSIQSQKQAKSLRF